MTKIMVVDDAAFMRLRCNRLLSEAGYEVIEAANGSEAIDKFKKEKPDGVLLDITMPKMDGIVTLQELKKLDPGVRVSMLTAMGQRGMVINALKSGAMDFIVKPFDGKRVLNTVRNLVS